MTIVKLTAWVYFDTMTIPRKAIGGNSEVQTGGR